MKEIVLNSFFPCAAKWTHFYYGICFFSPFGMHRRSKLRVCVHLFLEAKAIEIVSISFFQVRQNGNIFITVIVFFSFGLRRRSKLRVCVCSLFFFLETEVKEIVSNSFFQVRQNGNIVLAVFRFLFSSGRAEDQNCACVRARACSTLYSVYPSFLQGGCSEKQNHRISTEL